MIIQEVNLKLQSFGKKPTTAKPAAVSIASLKQRVAEVRKNVEAAYEQAHKLKAYKQTPKLHGLIKTLTELDVTLNKISKTCAHSYPTAPGF